MKKTIDNTVEGLKTYMRSQYEEVNRTLILARAALISLEQMEKTFKHLRDDFENDFKERFGEDLEQKYIDDPWDMDIPF